MQLQFTNEQKLEKILDRVGEDALDSFFCESCLYLRVGSEGFLSLDEARSKVSKMKSVCITYDHHSNVWDVNRRLKVGKEDFLNWQKSFPVVDSTIEQAELSALRFALSLEPQSR